MKYNTNKTAYKRQIELFSVIPNFISRTICRHFRPGQENTFYGHDLKVLHTRLSQKKGGKEKGIEDRAHSQLNDTLRRHYLWPTLCLVLLQCLQVFIHRCSFEMILPTSSSSYCLSLQNVAIHWFEARKYYSLMMFTIKEEENFGLQLEVIDKFSFLSQITIKPKWAHELPTWCISFACVQ